MAAQRILVIQGHPDTVTRDRCHVHRGLEHLRNHADRRNAIAYAT